DRLKQILKRPPSAPVRTCVISRILEMHKAPVIHPRGVQGFWVPHADRASCFWRKGRRDGRRALVPRSGKPGWRRGRLPLPLAARTAAEGLIGPFSFAFGRSPPVGCLDHMTIERLTPTEAATAVRRSAAKSPGIFAAEWPPRPSGRRRSVRC